MNHQHYREREKTENRLRLRSLQRGIKQGLISKIFANDHIEEFKGIGQTTNELTFKDQFLLQIETSLN